MKHSGRIDALRKRYPAHDLRRIFINRLDDDLFGEIGASHVPKETRLHLEASRPHVLVWTGYEILLGINK